MWYSYTSCSEADQLAEPITRVTPVTDVRDEGVRGEEAYRRIDRRIRSILSHNKHIPMVSVNIATYIHNLIGDGRGVKRDEDQLSVTK